MARELDINIKIDGGQSAKRELADVDRAIDGVVDGAKASQAPLTAMDRGLEKVGQSARASERFLTEVDKTLKDMGGDMQGAANKALVYAQAIKDAGGASALSADQQKKAATVIREGVAEYERLGKEAPAAVKAVSAELEKLGASTDAAGNKTKEFGKTQDEAGKSTQRMAGFTDLLTSKVRGLVSAGALVAAAKTSLDYASSLVKTAAATDATVRGVQRIENIAVTTNTELEALTRGTNELQRRIADGDKGALAAMKELGIQTERWINLKADDKFIAVASALGQVNDQGKKLNLAKDLFRNWQEVVPALTSDVEQLADSISTMSESQVKDLARVEQQWQSLLLQVKRTIAEIVALASPLVVTVEFVWRNLPAGQLQELIDSAPPGARARLESHGAFGSGKDINLSPESVLNIGNGPQLPRGFDPSILGNARIGGKTLAEQLAFLDPEAVAMRELVEQLSGREAISASRQWMDAVAQIGGITKLTTADQRSMNEVLQDALDAYRRLGREAPAQLRAVALQTSALVMANRAIGTGLGTMPASVRPLPIDLTTIDSNDISMRLIEGAMGKADFFGHYTNPARQPSLGGTGTTSQPGAQTGPGFFGRTGITGDSLMNVGMMAATGGGNIGQSLGGMLTGGAVQGLMTDSTGKLMGGTLGSFLPGIGTILGTVLGGLVGKLFGPSEESAKVSPERDKFFNRHGGTVDSLGKELTAPGGVSGETANRLIAAVFDAKTVVEYERAVTAVESALAAAAEQQRVFTQAVEDANAALDTVESRLTDVTQITPEVQAGLKGALDAKTPQEFLEKLTEINTVLDEQAKKHNRLKELAAKYGLSLKDMGKEFAQKEVDSMAKTLIDDLKDLTDAGANSEAVLKGMASEYSKLVQAAKTSGSEIPLSMKPTLEKLIAMGGLVDENGRKLTNLDGLKFGDTLESNLLSVKDVVLELRDAIRELADAWRGVTNNAKDAAAVEPPEGPKSHTRPPSGEFPTGGYSGTGPFEPRDYDTTDIVQTSHTGAIIRAAGLERFHRGGRLQRLAFDERLIIGQTDEGVLNRAAMGNLGAERFHALNRGVSPEQVFQAAPRAPIAAPGGDAGPIVYVDATGATFLDGASFDHWLDTKVFPRVPGAITKDIGGVRRVIKRAAQS